MTENQLTPLEQRTLALEKLKFRTDIFKWAISSVVIVIATFVIDHGLKERTAGIQEMQAFEKYVEVILKADNIEARWKLSEYFAVVTPTPRLRDRWQAYQDLIRADYKAFKALKEKEIQLQNATFAQDSSTQTVKKLLEVQQQLAPYEKRLASTEVSPAETAQQFEEEGYSYLAQKDVTHAIIAFRKSEAASNGYNSSYDIAKYLNKHKATLANKNSGAWNTALKTIATDYSWKMPEETKTKLLEVSRQ